MIRHFPIIPAPCDCADECDWAHYAHDPESYVIEHPASETCDRCGADQ